MTTKSDTQSFAIRLNVWLLRMTRNWLKIALGVLIVFVTLPFVAPTLMQLGVEGPARLIYRVYSPFCHQFAFRSFFLYGEQPVYPRDLAETDWRSFESYANELEHFDETNLGALFDETLIFSARSFIGNEQMGYKITLCERDIFIYLALLTGGFLYALPFVRRRLRPVPLWLYVFLGLGPIGLDGFSQLLGYPPFSLWPPRETIPTFRVVTGMLFGFMNAWLAFPYLEAAMYDTRIQIEDKLQRAGISV